MNEDLKMNEELRLISELRKEAEAEMDETGKARLVLWRDYEDERTDTCPLCGKRHSHGIGDGHRVCHCFSHECNYILGDEAIFRNKDGHILKARDGYMVRTRYRKKTEARQPHGLASRQPAFSL